MSTCKACGETRRKVHRAIVLTSEGPVSGLVCGDCMTAGLRIVPASRPSAAPVRMVRNPNLDEAIRKLDSWSKTAAHAARTSETIATSNHESGRAEAFDSAIELLRKLQRGEGDAPSEGTAR